jgi:hypothetical protein
VVSLPQAALQHRLSPPVGVSASIAPPPGTLPVYVIGRADGRDVLYREFRPIRPEGSGLGDNIQAALIDMISGRPLDPDYHSEWPGTAGVRSVEVAQDTMTVDLTGVGPAPRHPALAVQQLVYTATAAAAQLGQPGVVKVRIRVNGVAVSRLWGVDARAALTRSSTVDTLAPVWLSSPQEGDHVGRRFGVQVVGAVPGAAASLVIWDGSGAVVFQRTVQLNADAPARGEARLTVSLPPGEYRIEAYYVADDGSPAAPDDHVVTVD